MADAVKIICDTDCNKHTNGLMPSVGEFGWAGVNCLSEILIGPPSVILEHGNDLRDILGHSGCVGLAVIPGIDCPQDMSIPLNKPRQVEK